MQPRPNPNYVNNPQQQRRPNPQQRPPDSFTGRKRRRKIQINAGAVIFVLLIGAVVGISAYQISKNPAVNVSDGSQAQYEEIIQNAQNSESIGEGTDSLGDTSSEVLTPETDAAEEEGGYKTVTVQNSTISEGDLVLVNFNYAYDRVDDVTLMNAYNERTGKIKVSSTTLGMIPEAFAALEELVAGLVADTGCDDLLLYSGHRTIADQQRIWDSNLASYGEDYTKTYVAVPGHSEHHTGLACDLGFYTDEGLSIPLVDHEYGTWVWAHCTEYGYILRYPADKAEITGIGHERDDTVIDKVAHTRVKTPTAAAEFLIAKMDKCADVLDEMSSRLMQGVRNRLLWEHRRMESLKQRIPSAVYKRIADAKYGLLTAQRDLQMASRQFLSIKKHRMELLQQRLNDALPEKQLARGYSITLKDGKAVKDASVLKEGDKLVTVLHQGSVESEIKVCKNIGT